MRKIIAVLFLLLSTIAFSQTSGIDSAISDSNRLLQQALDKINALEKENTTLRSDKDFLTRENKFLKDTNLMLQASLAEASIALKQSNEILQKASNRITADQNEINSLRLSIKELISAGVEIQAYRWEISALIGYPLAAELLVSWNPQWAQGFGLSLGVQYYFESQKAGAFVGAKINLK
jgi:hypothetical protein